MQQARQNAGLCAIDLDRAKTRVLANTATSRCGFHFTADPLSRNDFAVSYQHDAQASESLKRCLQVHSLSRRTGISGRLKGRTESDLFDDQSPNNRILKS
jgi:hypothetical protein